MVFQIQKDAFAQIVAAPLSVIVASIVLLPGQALAVPVVPNFTQGSMSSHTETTQTITETINSSDDKRPNDLSFSVKHN